MNQTHLKYHSQISRKGIYYNSVKLHLALSISLWGRKNTYLKLRYTVKPVLSSHSKRRPKIVFQDRLSLNAGQKYCRMLQGERSAILSTFIKLPFFIKTFILSIF